MQTKVTEQLKTGIIKNIAWYGDANLPPSPYVLIKLESDILGRGTVYKIFVHFPPGYQEQLKSYVRKDLMVLLDGFEATTVEGNHQRLDVLEEDIGFIVTDNDDKTISMSRSFLVASKEIL